MHFEDNVFIAAASPDSSLIDLLEDSSVGAERQSVVAGAELFTHDTAATHLFLLVSGQIRIFQRGPTQLTRLVDVIGPQEWFGVAVLAGSSTYGAQAVAVSHSIVWRIAINRLRDALRARPEVLELLNRDLARDLVEAREEASRLIFEDCNQRLISALIRLSDSVASTPREGGVVLRMTHNQLAQAIGAARETVSLGLTQLRNQNLLRTGRNQLFYKPDDLRRFRMQ